ncbi:hypothetical protein BDZ89DRAFT_966085 [Hymenopellis radicata]|nr:hypothetical protein BDZ89DRAFT_966085 [Hymenopellis radicata]
MFEVYSENLTAILEHDTSLHRNFANSVFTLLTVNVGRRTVTNPHRDRANRPRLASGFAFGEYDPTLGSQMVLDGFKLVIDFPPGTTIFIPLAIVTHSNTNIFPDETRYSITQYTPGALFRRLYQTRRG